MSLCSIGHTQMFQVLQRSTLHLKVIERFCKLLLLLLSTCPIWGNTFYGLVLCEMN